MRSKTSWPSAACTHPKAARIAALETRRAKDYGIDAGKLRDLWIHQAYEAGFDPTVVHAALGTTWLSPIDERALRLGTDMLLGPDGLTSHAGVFDRRDALRAWCELLPQGAPVETVEHLAGATIDDARVVPLVAGNPYPKFSTAELVTLEQRLVRAAAALVDQRCGEVPEPVLRAALDGRPELSPEQVAVVAAITTSGNGVDLLVAAAGTGKTFCLDAARDAWQRTGYRVIGTALAATAAAQLQTQTAIPSDTLALRAIQLAEGTLTLDERTVLVIDEAAMCGTRQLAPLLDAATAAATKLVLVGDPRQLAAIRAGGLLAGLSTRLPTVTLSENRRQRHQWERDALTWLRDGNIDDALAAYEVHDRVVTASTAIDLRNRIAADWHSATLAGERAVILAERRYDVDDLNQRVRRYLAAGGDLDGPTLSVDGRAFAAGDRVLCLRNNRRLGVHNGTLATVTTIDPDARAVTIRADAGTVHHLPARYLDDGHLTHGYALTIHKSQGLTVDRCLILASDTLDHNAGYTALSRGRAENHIYLHGALPDPEAHYADRHTSEPRDVLAAALTRDRADRLAIDHHVHLDALRTELHDLHAGRSSLLSVRDAMPPDRTADIDALTSTHEQLLTQHADAHERLQHARPSLRHRRERLVQHLAAERALDHAAAGLARVEHALTHATVEQRAHDQYRHDHQPDLDRLTTIEERISHRLDQLVDALTEHPPTYLEQLGPPPPVDGEQRLWRHAADLIERYRSEHHITDPRHALGTEPSDPDANEAWRTATQQLRFYCTRLTTLPPVEHTIEPDRGLDLGIDL